MMLFGLLFIGCSDENNDTSGTSTIKLSLTFKGSEVKIFRCPATVKGFSSAWPRRPATFVLMHDGKARWLSFPLSQETLG